MAGTRPGEPGQGTRAGNLGREPVPSRLPLLCSLHWAPFAGITAWSAGSPPPRLSPSKPQHRPWCPEGTAGARWSRPTALLSSVWVGGPRGPGEGLELTLLSCSCNCSRTDSGQLSSCVWSSAYSAWRASRCLRPAASSALSWSAGGEGGGAQGRENTHSSTPARPGRRARRGDAGQPERAEGKGAERDQKQRCKAGAGTCHTRVGDRGKLWSLVSLKPGLLGPLQTCRDQSWCHMAKVEPQILPLPRDQNLTLGRQDVRVRC